MKVLKILLVESLRIRYIIPEIIFPFCHCHPKNLITIFECGNMRLPLWFYIIYIIFVRLYSYSISSLLL